ncbi:helix-turn-helix transcriptional regulator [Phormidium tenue FACHB-886]|nr:helix-turn-helix transcriptional regulator [Phormidium tenue FACHB-886]
MPAKKQRLAKEQIPAQDETIIDVTHSATLVESSAITHQSAEASDAQRASPRRRGRPSSFKRPMPSPDIFPDGGISRMASNRVIWEGCNVLTQGEDLGWVGSEEGSPYYESPVAKGKGFVSFWVTNELFTKHPGALEGEAALALIEEFDIRAACLHLVYAAHATQLERPWEQSFVLNDTQLERYLGLDQNRNFKNKQEKLQVMLDLAKQPCHLLVYVSWPDQGKVKAFSVSRTWLWEIAEPVMHFQECLKDDDGKPLGEKQLIGFTLRIRCGYWAQYFLNQERLSDKSGYYEYGILSQGLLHDIMSTWHHHEGAARLMTWLLFKTKVNRTSPLMVETLMKVAFGEKLLEEAKAGFRQRAKLVRLWSTSLKVLVERGWGLTPDPETYPPQYWLETSAAQLFTQIPDDPEQAAEFWAKDAAKPKGQRLTDTTKRSRAAFEQLLTSKLWIKPPMAIAEKLNELDDHRASYKERLPAKTLATSQPVSNTALALQKQPKSKGAVKGTDEEITGKWVKRIRTSRKMSQRDLANWTGISQKMISLIENGDRPISPINKERLLRVFQEP